MDAAVLVLAAIGLVVSVFAYFASVLSGGTKSSVAGSTGGHSRIIADLGPVLQTYTTYSPWRFRFGAAMLMVGIACVVAARVADVPTGVNLVAGFSLLFGIVTMLYVAFAPINRLELHARGLALHRGRSDAVAVYYPDIKEIGHRTVT